MAPEPLLRGARPLTDLSGRVAVVTGSTDGIGRAIAQALGEAGAAVVVTSRRQERVEQTVGELRAAGIAATGQPTDVRDEGQVNALLNLAEEQDGVFDLLVNCAGGSFGDRFKRGPLLDLEPSDLLEAYRLNVVGSFICASQAVRRWGERGGVVVNVSSMGGIRTGSPGMGAYGASKAALNNLTKSMAKEWAPRVRVNAVAPGAIDTPRTTAARTPERLSAELGKVLLGRLGTPDEVAELVLYLASPASSWTTGAVYELDGGQAN